jgi:cytochrome b6-f complex iron-sulfur subunit
LAESLKPTSDREAPPRRRFLVWLTRSFLALFAWVIGAFLSPPTSRRSLAERVLRAGRDDSLGMGDAVLIRHGREPVFVIRTDNGALVGLSAVCTHLHCVLEWDGAQENLVCPCHEGAFDLNGNVLKGPPPRSLTRYRVETRLGEIFIHL